MTTSEVCNVMKRSWGGDAPKEPNKGLSTPHPNNLKWLMIIAVILLLERARLNNGKDGGEGKTSVEGHSLKFLLLLCGINNAPTYVCVLEALCAILVPGDKWREVS